MATAVILGLSPTALYVCRELGMRGISVHGYSDEDGVAGWSRFLANRGDSTVASATDLIERLRQLRESATQDIVLFPTSDRYVEFVAGNAEQLRGMGYRFQKSYAPGAVNNYLNKDDFYGLCRQHGMPFPEYRYAAAHELEAVAGALKFPLLLKPAVIHEVQAYLRGRKVVVVSSEQQVQELVRTVPPDSRWLAQQLIDGPESNIWIFAGLFEQGAMLQGFTARKLRQYPPGFGCASLALSETNAEVSSITADFLRKLSFDGICGAEYKLDKSGRLVMIEINIRPTLWFQLTHAAGMRLAGDNFDRLMNAPQSGAHTPVAQVERVWWRYTAKDLASRAFYRFGGGDFVLQPPDIPAQHSGEVVVSPIFDWQDLRPSLGEASTYLRKGTARLLARLKNKPRTAAT